jgi:hypothetical protein
MPTTLRAASGEIIFGRRGGGGGYGGFGTGRARRRRREATTEIWEGGCGCGLGQSGTPALYRREETRVAWPGAGAGAGADSGQGRHEPRVPDRVDGGACSLILMEPDGCMDGHITSPLISVIVAIEAVCLFGKLD